MNMEKVIDRGEIAAAVATIAGDMKATYGTQPVLCIAVMNGAAFFAVDLMRQLPENFTLESVRVKSYIGQESSGELQFLSKLPNVEGKAVVLLDEICDSGLTLSQLQREVMNAGADTCRTAVLLNVGHDTAVHTPSFIGHQFTADPGFLVGYGMDWHGTNRQLQDIFRAR